MASSSTAVAASPLALICAALVAGGLIAYATLGGADFGGGVWSLIARGPRAERQREAVAHALGPVWEANNVWLIYVITVTWTAFPVVYAGVSTALFIPIVLALVGIVLRGAGFGLRSQYARSAGMAATWGYIFQGASAIAPFMLGALAGGIASGDIHIRQGVVRANLWTTWTTPFALTCGLFAVTLCATLAATYLAVEAQTAGDAELVEDFRLRALVAGAVTAAVGALAALLAAFESPRLWAGLIGQALPLSLGAVLIGLGTAYMLLRGRFALARYLVAGEMTCILAAWAVAQYPYLIIPDVTIASAAAPESVLLAVTLASAAGMLLLFPSLWYLFHSFKGRHQTAPTQTAANLADEGFRRAFAPSDGEPPTGTGGD
ncbi:MAG TPA: cytochrome d ubiquinol oxidase subunit II [Ktedonobacterales bacterium]|nr:cytochrome d ubiquinol oxidase subunit II [Ktedonobacterales bacterium]